MVTKRSVQIRERYLVDEVRYTEEMAAHLHSLEAGNPVTEISGVSGLVGILGRLILLKSLRESFQLTEADWV